MIVTLPCDLLNFIYHDISLIMCEVTSAKYCELFALLSKQLKSPHLSKINGERYEK
jgi:hypothetical protein